MIGSIYNVGFGNGYTNYNNSNYLVTNNLKKYDKSNQQQTLTGDSFENSQNRQIQPSTITIKAKEEVKIERKNIAQLKTVYEW